jgi:Ca-activated chloride channel family protein
MNEKNNTNPSIIDESLVDDVLDQDIPPADPNARKIAINSALSTFAIKDFEISSQEKSKSTRHIDIEGNAPSISIWRSLLKLLNSINSNRAVAGVAVGIACLTIVSILPTPFEQQKINVRTVEPVDIENASLDELATLNQSEREPEAIGRVVSIEEIVVSASKRLNKPLDTPVSIEAQSKRRQIFKKQTEAYSSYTYAPSTTSLDARLAEDGVSLDYRTEEYANAPINSIKLVKESPVSTFSVDVDTASYSLIRNQINSGYLPPSSAVRVEEMINYFDYSYPLPNSESAPFKATTQVLDSPWNKDKKLIHIGIQGYDVKPSEKPDSNLVFLLDVSGSMNQANKLPLVKQSISLLLNTLKADDKVSIVVYAGAAGVVLEPTNARDKDTVMAALNRLQAGGSTAGGAGIELAYRLAEKHFIADGVNRIVLATDGDFNVGQSSNEELKRLVERKRQKGVMLSVLGFGRGNYQDDMMQTLAQNGNGVAAYIDSLSEAKKVLVDEASSALFTIAKDVKLQLEFNPQIVSEYRLVGYQTRQLKREDFNNDKVDAGDIGSGHSVTAIYEIGLLGSQSNTIEPLRYAKKQNDSETESNELGFLKIRYKLPTENTSKLIESVIRLNKIPVNIDALFSIAVASFGQKLSGEKYASTLSYSEIADLAKRHIGNDPYGHKAEFIQLVELADLLNKQ